MPLLLLRLLLLLLLLLLLTLLLLLCASWPLVMQNMLGSAAWLLHTLVIVFPAKLLGLGDYLLAKPGMLHDICLRCRRSRHAPDFSAMASHDPCAPPFCFCWS